MKVSTDSLLLGSWCQPLHAKTILDIGTGTGVLSLMMAQKSHYDCQITALEIDDNAALQAQSNFAASPWPEKLQLIHSDFIQWYQQRALQVALPHFGNHQFDLIVANPPWFEYAPSATHNASNQQRNSARTVARQQTQLTLPSLMQSVTKLLASSGRLYMVLPAAAEHPLREIIAKSELAIAARLDVSSTPNKTPYCQIWQMQHSLETQNKIEVANQITIRDSQGSYTPAYQLLCRDFYLNF